MCTGVLQSLRTRTCVAVAFSRDCSCFMGIGRMHENNVTVQVGWTGLKDSRDRLSWLCVTISDGCSVLLQSVVVYFRPIVANKCPTLNHFWERVVHLTLFVVHVYQYYVVVE